MATIREDLRRYFTLHRLQPLREPCLGFADCCPAGDQALERPHSRRTGYLPGRRPAEVTKLSGEARQHGAMQRLIVVAPNDLIEVRDPGEDARRQHVGPPGDAMPGNVFPQPALHQIPSCLTGGPSGSRKVRNPVEAMPSGYPFWSG